MKGKKNTNVLVDILEPSINKLGYELVDLEMVSENGQWFLRIYIDHQNSISLEDCEKVSRELDWVLDESDPVPHRYILEVSSPGAERPLKNKKDFIRFTGRKIRVSTYKPINNCRKFQGELLGINESGDIVLKIESDKKVCVPVKNIAKANLVLEF